MFDLLNETSLSLSEAAKRVPPSRNTKHIHRTTLIRWITQGLNGIRLEAVRVGGRWITSVEAIQRFSDALTAAKLSRATTQEPSQRRRVMQAEQELDEIGI